MDWFKNFQETLKKGNKNDVDKGRDPKIRLLDRLFIKLQVRACKM